MESAGKTLTLLNLDPYVPVVTRDNVLHAKADPDVFIAAAEQLNVPLNHCVVVGDSVWDMLAARRAWALGTACSVGEQQDSHDPVRLLELEGI
jgi:beta-phosphoglucomutase-like phosphatase (HAD superfamily)